MRETIYYADGITELLPGAMRDGETYSVTRKDGKLICLNPSCVTGTFTETAHGGFDFDGDGNITNLSVYSQTAERWLTDEEISDMPWCKHK